MSQDRFVFAHLADAHVGAWPRQPAVRAELRESVLRAIAHVEELHAEFLLISGDLFHTPVPDPAEAAPVTAALRRLVDGGTRIYAIYGSHDYVAHKTSWLDVLAEAGVFVRVAPETVRSEGTRWTLPYLVDEPTGARIAGISGRSHGLDRAYFRAVDSEAFRASEGFHIFQFHAAVEEYLPPSMQGKIQGIRRSDLPGGCEYYAGGHIHVPYVGEGPDGGLLVNPGAVYGTSTPDLDAQKTFLGRHGLAVVRVENRRPRLEFFDPCRPSVSAEDAISITSRSRKELQALILARAQAALPPPPGREVVIRLDGELGDRSYSELGLSEAAAAAREAGVPVEILIGNVRSSEAPSTPALSESDIERQEFERLAETATEETSWLLGEEGRARLRELLRELGTPRGDGEAAADYIEARKTAALRILDVRRSDPR